MAKDKSLVLMEQIEGAIYVFRGQRVMLDADLAELYGVTAGRLNEAVKRHWDRFPNDFLFQLTREEFANLKGQLLGSHLKSQIAMSSSSWGGRRRPPYAFTEQGVAMLSSVLNSPRAIRVNIEIMRAFVRLRRMLATHADLERKLLELGKKYDTQFKAVFEAIRQLMAPSQPSTKKIGFLLREKRARYGKK